MPTLTVTKNYQDGQTLTQDMLNSAFDSVSTFVNATKLDSTNIQTGGISTDNLAASAVTDTKLNTSAVTTAKINDAAVTTTKIADANVTTAKIADSNVTTAKIADANVTTGKLANGAVTPGKMAAMNIVTANISDSSSSSGSWASLGAATSFTGSGRPVHVTFQADGADLGYFYCQNFTGADSNYAYASFRILKDGAAVIGGEWKLLVADTTNPGHYRIYAAPSSMSVYDTSGSTGARSYQLQVNVGNAAWEAGLTHGQMVVLEH